MNRNQQKPSEMASAEIPEIIKNPQVGTRYERGKFLGKVSIRHIFAPYLKIGYL